jgi:uncharacterized protein (TIGR02453 family)
VNLEHLTRFLVELSYNNDKPWFDKHRAEYQSLREDFVRFMDRVIVETASFDSSVKGIQAKDCLFRINRDTRFSHNKSPYKTTFSAAISPQGRHSDGPVYYVQISGPGESLTAGGVYMPGPERLAAIRTFVSRNPKKADALLKNKILREQFGGLDEESKLKRYPKGFDDGSELLKFKNFTVSQAFDAMAFDADGLLEHITMSFRAMRPVMKFVQEASK